MIIKSVAPFQGTLRKRKVFAFLPIRLNHKKLVWLEKVTIHECYDRGVWERLDIGWKPAVEGYFFPFVSTEQGSRFIMGLIRSGFKQVNGGCFLTAVVLLRVWKMQVWLGVTEEDLRNELNMWVKVVFT